jgi:hypothetical protein
MQDTEAPPNFSSVNILFGLLKSMREADSIPYWWNLSILRDSLKGGDSYFIGFDMKAVSHEGKGQKVFMAAIFAFYTGKAVVPINITSLFIVLFTRGRVCPGLH